MMEILEPCALDSCSGYLCYFHSLPKELQNELSSLFQQLKEAEKIQALAISEWSSWKDVLLSNMTEKDWQETMDGLRGLENKS